MAERDLDVVVFGATGVTGRRVAAYLAARAAETELRWAAAARDTGKLARVLAEDGVSAPETIAADVSDSGSLAAMAGRARVVLDLVGPYTLYGRPVIAACVAQGAHYADLTGEMPFVRRTIDEFDAAAQQAGVKLVQTCGFESLPGDLAVALAARAARERHGEALAEVDLVVSVTKTPPGAPRPSDWISGGTSQSMVAALDDEDPAVVLDPAALITDPALAEEVRRRSPISLAPRMGADGSAIAAMLPFAYINPAVIQRSAQLTATGPYTPFRYREGVALGGSTATLPLRLAAAGLASGIQVWLRAGIRASAATRRRIVRGLGTLMPASGFGPRADRLEGWRWRMALSARTDGGKAVGVTVDGDGHPGYLTTARMLGEAGMLLAEDGATPRRAGCLTPAAALGTGVTERFARAGLRFALAPR